MNKLLHFDIFCKIIDNFGDIGVSYRLSKELVERYKCNVRLFVSDLYVFNKIENKIDINKINQNLNNKLEIIAWTDEDSSKNFISSLSPNEIIIEMFACSLPEYYSDKISLKNIWINLEYLSAENWVEDCHLKPSFEKGILKYFFFPGFTNRTGGLNFESYISEKTPIIKDKIISDYQLNPKTILISVFCYENKGILSLLANTNMQNIAFIIPNSIFSNYLKNNCYKMSLKQISENIFVNKYNIPLIIIPLSNQEFYDSLVKSCDFNIVRGEDSFVRTQILSKPFIWNIYKQDNNAHIQKLNSFLDKYTDHPNIIDEKIRKTMICLSNRINENLDDNEISYYEENSIMFHFLLENLDKLNHLSKNWQNQILNNGSISYNLIKFAESLKK